MTVKSVVSEGGIEEVIYQDTISPTAMGARKPGSAPIAFAMPIVMPVVYWAIVMVENK